MLRSTGGHLSAPIVLCSSFFRKRFQTGSGHDFNCAQQLASLLRVEKLPEEPCALCGIAISGVLLDSRSSPLTSAIELSVVTSLRASWFAGFDAGALCREVRPTHTELTAEILSEAPEAPNVAGNTSD